MDVSADRDFALDFLYAATRDDAAPEPAGGGLDSLFESEEFGWLELGDGVTSGSSLMPQKKNPDSLELIRGKCGRVIGDLTSLMVTMKGLPMTYNRDMQEDKEPLFDAAGATERVARDGGAVVRIGAAESGGAARGGGGELGGGDGPGRGAGARAACRSTRRTKWSGGWCWRA